MNKTSQPLEQSGNDLFDEIHSGFFSASLAAIKPTPMVIAAIVAAISKLVVGSPSKTDLRAPPTATRMAPIPARVVFVFFIWSGIIETLRNRRRLIQPAR